MTFDELYTRALELLEQDSPSGEDIDAWVEAAMADRIKPVMEAKFAEMTRTWTLDEMLAHLGLTLPGGE